MRLLSILSNLHNGANVMYESIVLRTNGIQCDLCLWDLAQIVPAEWTWPIDLASSDPSAKPFFPQAD